MPHFGRLPKTPLRVAEMSLGARLFWFALAALCPVFAVVLLFQYQLTEERTAEVKAGLSRQAMQANSDLLRVVESMRTLLISVAANKSVQEFDDAQCTPFLQRIARSLPQVSSIGVIDLAGNVRCIDDPGRLRPTYADRDYFRGALAANGFTVGLFTQARTDPSRRLLPFSMPLENGAGNRIGVVAVGLSLDYLNGVIGAWELPPGGSLTIADRAGMILARNPMPERFVGTRIPEQYQAWVTASSPGMAEVTSQDGTRRLLAYVPATMPPEGIYLSTGVATDVAYAPVWRAWWWNLAAVLVGLLTVGLVSQLAGRYLIKAPANRLISLAEAWANGRPTETATSPSGPREFMAIAGALNRMGAELVARARAAEDSEARLRLTIQAAPYPLLLETEDGAIVQANDSWWRQAGFDPGRTDNPHPRKWLGKAERNPFAMPFDGSQSSGEWRFVGGDGNDRVWQFGIVPLGALSGGSRLRLIAAADLTQLKSAARRQQLLVDELNHRVKNTLAIVQAIGAQTADYTADPDEFNRKFVERLQVLARTHDLLTARAWDTISLRDLIDAEFAAVKLPATAFELVGPDVQLPSQSAVMLAMVLHELAMNALQHGCFSAPSGRLRVMWHLARTEPVETETVSLSWEESCPAPLPDPGPPGFGLRLFSRVAASLGSGTIDLRREGLRATLRMDLPRPKAAVRPSPAPRPDTGPIQ